MSAKLRIIPLGGFGEVGRNLTAIEYDDQIIIIDCGLMFPESDMPGVDLILPNFTYLQDNVDKVLAYFITHGHEDHHGALPYVLPHVPAPIYATALTRGLIEVKLKEHGLLDMAEIHTITTEDVVDIGPFHVEPFRVSHSIPDTVGFAVDTPLGLIVHTAEYKFDLTPVDGETTDIHRLAEYGQRGVLALLSDSTNAERPGHTPSEAIVRETLERVFERAPGRIIISTFASNISRVQETINVATEFGRKIALVGRSMENNCRMALELGYLKAEPGVIVGLRDLEKLPLDEVAIVCTGTQGEPTSALVRMANDNHRDVSLIRGDTVVLSATPIPGNEELVHRTLNELFRHGADVLYSALTPVHVSGHANREEQKLMLKIVAPRYFIPNGGEHRMLCLHGRMAQELGMAAEDVFILESGDAVEFDGQGAKKILKAANGEYIYVDGKSVGTVTEAILRDRRQLSRGGFITPIVVVDRKTRRLVADPEIVTRGFVIYKSSAELIAELIQHVAGVVDRAADGKPPESTSSGGRRDRDRGRDFDGGDREGSEESGASGAQRGGATAELAERVKNSLAAFVQDRTGRRPVVLPIVVEV